MGGRDTLRKRRAAQEPVGTFHRRKPTACAGANLYRTVTDGAVQRAATLVSVEVL